MCNVITTLDQRTAHYAGSFSNCKRWCYRWLRNHAEHAEHAEHADTVFFIVDAD